jgi:hypothetical protein
VHCRDAPATIRNEVNPLVKGVDDGVLHRFALGLREFAIPNDRFWSSNDGTKEGFMTLQMPGVSIPYMSDWIVTGAKLRRALGHVEACFSGLQCYGSENLQLIRITHLLMDQNTNQTNQRAAKPACHEARLDWISTTASASCPRYCPLIATSAAIGVLGAGS